MNVVAGLGRVDGAAGDEEYDHWLHRTLFAGDDRFTPEAQLPLPLRVLDRGTAEICVRLLLAPSIPSVRGALRDNW